MQILVLQTALERIFWCSKPLQIAYIGAPKIAPNCISAMGSLRIVCLRCDLLHVLSAQKQNDQLIVFCSFFCFFSEMKTFLITSDSFYSPNREAFGFEKRRLFPKCGRTESQKGPGRVPRRDPHHFRPSHEQGQD